VLNRFPFDTADMVRDNVHSFLQPPKPFLNSLNNSRHHALHSVAKGLDFASFSKRR